jgi:acetyltransferase-like isoleucine patch superfamily enzyme
MACALPVVATAVGGLPDLVEDGHNGFLVEPENPGEMAAALRTLAHDPELCAQMRRASYAAVTAHHNLAQLVDHLVQIYLSTAAKATHKANSRFSRMLARLHEAVVAPWKLGNELHCWLCQVPMRLLLAFNGIAWPTGARFYGLPAIQKHRCSHMQFGAQLCLRSAARSNPLGPAHPVILTTWRPGAHLELGHSFAMTGGSICAAEHIRIGDRVTVGANTTIVDTDFHPIDPQLRQQDPTAGETAPIVIEDDVFIGMNCLVLKGVRIGAGSTIGAGSVVTGPIPAHVVAAGNPARIIREL